ncbi:MAG: hypothetical protein HMLKMBBP_02469 [Planctomycetes bacterium]|nr:hypothetical protein [Planctomycetota bacterium]
MSSILREFWMFLRSERKWWMAPMLLVLGIVGAVAVVAALHPALAPFIYPLV